MKNLLSPQDIKFIDTYLSNSDINYEDVRIEMIDHVASAIEHQMNNGDDRDFYDIFKDYMVENKRLLERSGRKVFNGRIFKSVCIKFLKNLYSWQVLLGSPVLSLILYYVYQNLEGYDFIKPFVPIILMGALAIYPLIVFGKRKYSFLGNFFILVNIFYYLGYQFINYTNYDSIGFNVYMVLMSFFFAGSLKTIFDLVHYYRVRLLAI